MRHVIQRTPLRSINRPTQTETGDQTPETTLMLWKYVSNWQEKRTCGPFGIGVTFEYLQQAGKSPGRRSRRNTTQRPEARTSGGLLKKKEHTQWVSTTLRI